MLHAGASLAATLILVAVPLCAHAQPRPGVVAPGTAVTAAERVAAIDQLARELRASYVFPEKAAAVDSALRSHLAAGGYDSLGSAVAFAETLTRHLQDVTRDKHLRVRAIAGAPSSGTGARRSPAEQRQAALENNFGFGRTEVLPGNIGYVEIRSFGWWAPGARDSIGRIMSRIADADALIIDLRSNGGGSPQAVAFVSSYLFGETPVHLNSLYFRPANETEHFHTDPAVPGRKFGAKKPVYVLTSATTFSAAEEFTYNLQALRRTTTVGETTGGGAHPGGTVRIGTQFTAFIPSGRAINPITKTNWEGVGITPEIIVPRERALDAALEAARKALKGDAA